MSSSSSSSSSSNSNKPDVPSISSLLMNPQLMKDHIKRTTSTISSKCSSSSSSRGISSDTSEKKEDKNKDSSNKDSSSIHLPFDPDSVDFPYDALYHENNSNEDEDNNINLFSEIYSMAYASAGELYYYVIVTIVLILVKMANNDSRNSNCFKKVQLLI